MTTLVIAQNNRGTLHDSNAKLITAALKLGDEVRVAVVENQEQTLAPELAQLAGVTQVYQIPAPDRHALAYDQVADTLRPLMDQIQSLICDNTAEERQVLLRLAALLEIPPITGISSILNKQTFERPIYAGSLIERVHNEADKNFLTIRTVNFEPVAHQSACPITPLALSSLAPRVEMLEQIETLDERPDLREASIVIAGGRGLGSKENFAKLEGFANQLSAALGASRIAVDMGWAPHHLQVGQTGVQIAPDLYIAIGISGAVQHIAGIKDADKIIAINKDGEAPIFKVANYGLIGDLHTLYPLLQKALGKADPQANKPI